MSDLADNALDAARQENVTRILEAAERLFRYYGYAKTNVADIARELDMSPANIYRFFASKTEIHQALCSRMLDTSYQQAYDIAQLPLSASERLRRYAQGQHKLTVETMANSSTRFGSNRTPAMRNCSSRSRPPGIEAAVIGQCPPLRLGSWLWWRSGSPPPPETLLRVRRSESAGGFGICNGSFAFSCDAPGPPWRMLAGVFLEVDMRVPLQRERPDASG